jgi:HEAT repeat protein
MKVRQLRVITAALGLVLLGGCLSTGPVPEGPDRGEALERFLKEHPLDRSAEDYRAELAELRFAQARAAHTPLAYKRFIDEFPTSEQAPEARKLLEGLRFSAAQDADSIPGYEDFLREHPDGSHAAEARKRLDELCFQKAKGEGTLAAMQAYVARFPDSAHMEDAKTLVDDRAFAEATKKGPEAIADYLDAAPEGAHRNQARGLLLANDVEARIAAQDMAGAEKLQARASADQAAAIKKRIDQAELLQVAATLDPEVLHRFATTHPGPMAAKAEDLAKKAASPKAKEIRHRLDDLDPAAYARPTDELLHTLEAADPRDRWLAAEELGALALPEAIGPLLSAASGSRFEEVRRRSLVALKNIFDRLGPEAAEAEVRTRISDLRKMASGPRLFLELGLIEELGNKEAEARADFEHALRGDQDDLVALARLEDIDQRHHMFFDAAIRARRAEVEIAEADHAHDDEGDPPLLHARWLCGIAHAASDSLNQLKAIPPDMSRDFPEDIRAFVRKAEEVQKTTAAHLADAEDAARADRPDLATCEQDDVAPRLAEGVAKRLATIAWLVQTNDPLAGWPLVQLAQNDPSPEVRARAAKALEEMGSTTRSEVSLAWMH